jgi:hypothetical protein
VPNLTSRPARAVATAVVVVASAVRFEQFLSRRSLWLDEAMLANNIVGRGYGDLLDKLDNDQAAPPGFLWIERLCTQLFGHNEYALRALPLLAGVAVLPLAWWLARRYLGDVAATGAVTFLALAPAAVRYSTEVKQYSSDAFVVLAVLACACVAAEEVTRRRVAAFAVVASIALWLSHPAWFAVAVGSVMLTVTAFRTGRVRALLMAGVPIATSAAAAYAVNLREARANDALDSYWASGFPPSSASVPGVIRWIPGAAWRTLDQPGGVGQRWLALLLLAAGITAIRRRGRALGAALWGVVALTLVAGAVRLFPVRGRLVLYLVPLLAIALSAALARPWLRWFAGVGLVVLLVGPAGDLVDVARHPPALVEGRQAMEFVARHRRAGDLVYVHSTAVPTFDFYAERLGLHRDGVVGPTVAPAPCRPTPKPAADRAWLVFAYTLSTRPADEDAMVGAWFGDGERPRRTFRGQDASARLYDLAERPWPATGCWAIS